MIQLDFAFWKDGYGNESTIITGIDVLSGIGLAVMVESKEFSNYATTEVKKFVYEVGRSHGILQ